MYVNKNQHDIYVKGNDGKLVRVQPGQVIEADGKFADGLSNTEGDSSASSADVKAWEQRGDHDAANTDPSPSSRVNDAIAEARRAAQALLAATNQIVIGDDQAPYGPPSGVVTTVQAVKDNEHFGPHSASHVGAVEGAETAAGQIGGVAQATGAEVHNSQVEAAEEVADVAAQLAELHGGGSDSDGDGDEYEDLNGDELRAELQSRELPTTGRVDELRDRLRDDDAAKAVADDSGDGEPPQD